jgi:two-component system, chemotaxis family, chemotaxis protein CheY
MTSVLVIDDSDEVRSLIGQVLAPLGYEIREAENGVKGLDAYKEAAADVVVLDMFMPEKDGLETLRDLRQFDPNVRVIAMTGGGTHSNMGILKPALLMGAAKLLFKPFTLTELRTVVAEALVKKS